MKYEAVKLFIQDYFNWLETNTDIEIISIIYLSDFDKTTFLITFKRTKVQTIQSLLDEHNKSVKDGLN